MSGHQIYAVVTGDVVGSGKLSHEEQQRVPGVIQSVAEKISTHFRGSLHGEIDIFRGDSWQMVITSPEDSLRIGLFLRSRMQSEPRYRHLDTRFSIGFGTIDYLPEENVSTGMGQAFQLSGEGLKSCRKSTRMNLSFPDPTRSPIVQALNIITHLVDLQAQRWTAKQAEAISGALVGWTQREIAEKWVREPVSQQAISQHLEGAGWVQIKEGLAYFRKVLSNLFEGEVSNKLHNL